MRTTGDSERVQQAVEQNMTPMIDVVFLLVVFFLCIEFRVLEAKLPALLPKSAGGHEIEKTRPQLHVAIVCTNRGTEVPRDPSGESFLLQEHRVQWQVGTRTIADPGALRAELGAIRADRSTWFPDASGRPGPLPVVVEAGRETTYGDVTRTLDTIAAAGFEEIRFSARPGR